MAECRFCGGPNRDERVEIGFTHCMRKDCVSAWRRERIEDANLALVLVPKVGLQWVSRGDVDKNNRSSGR